MVFGKPKRIIKAFFPNYIFARFDATVSYRLVNWSRGVAKVIGFGGNPAPLSKEVIGEIKKRVDGDCVVRKALHFRAKDRIIIRSGPLKDLMGIFEQRLSGDGRVRVLLNLLNYDAKVDLHYSQVEKLSSG